MQRIATAVWKGGLRTGSGTISSPSGTLSELPFAPSFKFEEHPCTNPCELLAAAHASCVSLSLVQKFSESGHVPESVLVDAILFMDEEERLLRATRSYLDVRIRGTDLPLEDVKRLVADVISTCPISQILRSSVEITSRVEILPPALFSADSKVRVA